jgi:hypothetical protein
MLLMASESAADPIVGLSFRKLVKETGRSARGATPRTNYAQLAHHFAMNQPLFPTTFVLDVHDDLKFVLVMHEIVLNKP